jgi:hypothetical protein
MKGEGKLLWGWLPDIAAMAVMLLGRQKFNKHAQDSFSTGSLINCTCLCISATIQLRK